MSEADTENRPSRKASTSQPVTSNPIEDHVLERVKREIQALEGLLQTFDDCSEDKRSSQGDLILKFAQSIYENLHTLTFQETAKKSMKGHSLTSTQELTVAECRRVLRRLGPTKEALEDVVFLLQQVFPSSNQDEGEWSYDAWIPEKVKVDCEKQEEAWARGERYYSDRSEFL